MSMIIPGGESVSSASIMGSLTTYQGTRIADVAAMINMYKGRLGVGTTFTLIAQQPDTAYPWIIFKVETPPTRDYPDAESDLYYVVQGKLALYENYVAIKAARLSPEFVDKWKAVFMTGRVITD